MAGEKAPEPGWNPDEEDQVRQWFSKKAIKGTVNMGEFVTFVKTLDDRFKDEHITGGGGGAEAKEDDRIGWDSILEWIGL